MTYRPHAVALLLLPSAWAIAYTHGHKDALGLYGLAKFLEHTGNTAALILGLGALLFLAWREKSKADAVRVCLTMLTETVLYGAIKLIVWKGFHALPRPSGGDGGFPSGHTAAHCALAFLLTTRWPRLAPLWYGWAALMAWSRVEAGAHYPYQIAAGAVLGLSVAVAFSAARKGVPAPPEA